MKITILTTAVLFATCSLAAHAQDTAPGLNPRALKRIESRLNITPQQREQARAVLQQERPQLQQIWMSLVAERKELMALSANGSFDPAAAHAVAMKYADANANAAVERVKLRMQLAAILTPQQKEKLEQLRGRFAAVFGDPGSGAGDTL